jgi:hypothetical protein
VTRKHREVDVIPDTGEGIGEAGSRYTTVHGPSWTQHGSVVLSDSCISTFSISCCLVVTEFVFLLPHQHIKPLRSLPSYHKDVMCSEISCGGPAAGKDPNFNH